MRKRTARTRGSVTRFVASLLPALIWPFFMGGCAEEVKSPVAWKAKANEIPRSREARVHLYARTLRARLASDPYPLIDTEISLGGWKSAAQLIEEMNRAGVALAAITAASEDAIKKASDRYPGRLIPLTTSSAPESGAQAEGRRLADLKRQLAQGAFGIGKITWRPAPSDQVEAARAGETLGAIIRLAKERRAPLWIEMAPDDAGLGRLERHLREVPEAKIIWTQAGRIPDPDALPGYGHGLLRALSLRHVHLFFTLTQEPPPPTGLLAARTNHLFDPAGALSLEWRALLESRVRHFMVGSGFSSTDNRATYARKTRLFRQNVLAKISPSARGRIAYQNAWRLLMRQDWKP